MTGLGVAAVHSACRLLTSRSPSAGSGPAGLSTPGRSVRPRPARGHGGYHEECAGGRKVIEQSTWKKSQVSITDAWGARELAQGGPVRCGAGGVRSAQAGRRLRRSCGDDPSPARPSSPDRINNRAPHLRRTLRPHCPDRGHRPDAHSWRTASAGGPSRVRDPLQRAAPPPQPPAPPNSA